jgi:hypothetical protein
MPYQPENQQNNPMEEEEKEKKKKKKKEKEGVGGPAHQPAHIILPLATLGCLSPPPFSCRCPRLSRRRLRFAVAASDSPPPPTIWTLSSTIQPPPPWIWSLPPWIWPPPLPIRRCHPETTLPLSLPLCPMPSCCFLPRQRGRLGSFGRLDA